MDDYIPPTELLPDDDTKQLSPIPGKMLSPVPGKVSPVRPEHPEPYRPRIKPTRPAKPDAPITMPERPAFMDDAETAGLSSYEKAKLAIEKLREKMNEVAREFSEGLINQAQFNAIYRYYSEKRDITELLLERNPDSDAWKSVINTEHTHFLREHFAAKILSFGIYRIEGGDQIVHQGSLRLPPNQLAPIFAKLYKLIEEGRDPGPARRQLKDERWVVLIPGKITASVAIFSLEPAPMQRQLIEDIHRDFERANEKNLQIGNFDPRFMVFPHRVLFE
ncbi:MAG: hypothetical protein K8I82_06355 [Anaerolineae bacterium]|nr:hypothetical protein [Anaerolineae bacterium]